MAATGVAAATSCSGEAARMPSMADVEKNGQDTQQQLQALVVQQAQMRDRCAGLEKALAEHVREQAQELAKLQEAIDEKIDAATEQLGVALNAEREMQHNCLRNELCKLQETLQRSEDAKLSDSMKLSDGMKLSESNTLQDASLAAENVFSRRALWKIRHFKNRLAALLHASKERASFRSPSFSVSALPEMLMELQMAACEMDVLIPLPGAQPLPIPGSCSLQLWVPSGLQLAFRVTLGTGDASVSHRFEHSFAVETLSSVDQVGRVCVQMPNFCQLDQVWNRSTDTMEIAFELLEFCCRPVRVGCRPLEHRPPEVADEENDEISVVRSGTCETLLQERVSSELLAVRNRCVRRIEWRLEGCSRLLDLCHVGESVDSPAFAAAGLERIQLHFYPRGNETGTSEGPRQACALYISGPSRTTLRGTLWVGSNSRQLEHHFQHKGEAGGRSKFGPLETQLDCNDAIMLALDVVEVESDLPEVNGSLCLRGVGSVAGTANGSRVVGSKTTSGTQAVQGTRASLRLRRGDPSKTQELVKCVSLPTLDARHQHLPIMKGRRRGGIG